MTCFEATILQLEVVSPDTVLQVVKEAINPNTQFFNSLLLFPPTTIDKLFQRGNQYSMFEDDTDAVTKRIVATKPESRHYDGSKGKMGRDNQDRGEGGGGGGGGGGGSMNVRIRDESIITKYLEGVESKAE